MPKKEDIKEEVKDVKSTKALKKDTIKVLKETKKEEKKKKPLVKGTNKELKSISLEQESLVEIRSKRHIFQAIILIVIVLALIVILGNKSFLNKRYRNDHITVDIPMFLYYTSDSDNVVSFKTLRKSEYVRSYFEEYISHLDYYSCNGQTIYYDAKTKSAFKGITVEKAFAFKTVKINYFDKSIDALCEVK